MTAAALGRGSSRKGSWWRRGLTRPAAPPARLQQPQRGLQILPSDMMIPCVVAAAGAACGAPAFGVARAAGEPIRTAAATRVAGVREQDAGPAGAASIDEHSEILS